MRLLTFYDQHVLRLGVHTPHGVLDVASAAQQLDPTCAAIPQALWHTGLAALPPLRALVARAQQHADLAHWLRPLEALTLGPCAVQPDKILCVGQNYRKHIEETGARVPDVPVFFSKFTSALAASGETVPIPASARHIDYEAELAVVIGAEAHNIAEADALGVVLGYCCANDVSARDLQRRTSQWLLGKALPKFLPLGPFLVTADDVPDPQDLVVRCTKNGALRQHSTTADMLFSVAQIIAYASQHFTLLPGDVLLTGTPEGVILGRPEAERDWLTTGDEVVVSIDGLGSLVTRYRYDGKVWQISQNLVDWSP